MKLEKKGRHEDSGTRKQDFDPTEGLWDPQDEVKGDFKARGKSSDWRLERENVPKNELRA